MSSNGNGLANGKNGKNGKKRRRIIWAAIALVVLGGGGYGVKAALSPSRTIDPSKIASVERGDLARVVVATGKIQPLSKIEIKSKASGIVKKLYVDYGETRQQGQLLAELDKVQLEAAERASHANLQAAEAALDSSKATLERNKVDAEGPDVPFLKLNMERAEQMFKDGVMSKSLVEDAEKNYQLATEQTSERATHPGSLQGGNRQVLKRKWRKHALRWKTLRKTCAIPRLSARSTVWSFRAT